jgi:hypothetical protein
MIQETGYGHFYSVTYSTNTINISNTEGNNNQGFLLNNFKIGQTLDLYTLSSQLTFESAKVATPLGTPVITLVEKNKITCDVTLPDAGEEVALVGHVNTTESDEYEQEYLEMTNAKRINLFNLKSIVPSSFEGIVSLNQPLLENTEVKVEYYDVEPLIDDEDESWWSVNYEDALINAGAYKMEAFYRNQTAMNEWKSLINDTLVALNNVDAKKKQHDSSRMNDSFGRF